jgi:hypothetical protein
MLLTLLGQPALATTWSSDDFPLRWTIEQSPTSMDEADYEAEIQAAAAIWTDRNCRGDLFEKNDDAPHVVFTLGEPTEDGYPDCVDDESTGRRCTIWVPDDVEWTTQADAYEEGCTDAQPVQIRAAHAFGHVLGLGHTVDQGEVAVGEEMNSLMYWTQGCREDVELTSYDRELLTETYAQEPRLLADGEVVDVIELPREVGDTIEFGIDAPMSTEVLWTVAGQPAGNEPTLNVGPLERGSTSLKASVDWEEALCDTSETTPLLLTIVVPRLDTGPDNSYDTGQSNPAEACGCADGGLALIWGAPILLLGVGRRRRPDGT